MAVFPVGEHLPRVRPRYGLAVIRLRLLGPAGCFGGDAADHPLLVFIQSPNDRP